MKCRRRGWTVLSAFDGLSAGQIALERSGIAVDTYYASEINEYTIQVAKRNYPNTVHLGDVSKWESWDIKQPDILIGGSPCTNLSFAGRRAGLSTKCKQDITSLDQYMALKSDGFEFEGQSHLFWEFIAVRNRYKPKYFFLENVMFVKKWKDVFNEAIGFEPEVINSRLVSAQNRKRQYWLGKLNSKGTYDRIAITQPEDLGILLKDVVFTDALFKDYTICMHNLYGGFGETEHRTFLDKSPTIRTAAGGGHIPSLLLSDKAMDYMNREVADGRTHWDFKHHSDVTCDKSAAIVANFFKGVPYNVLKDWECIRHFHPVECERLQTIPDGYTEGVSKTQRLKMIGNSWTVDVISHIFNHLKGSTDDTI